MYFSAFFLFFLKLCEPLIHPKNKWDKVFMDGLTEICWRQPLKNLKEYGLLNQSENIELVSFMFFTHFSQFSILRKRFSGCIEMEHRAKID